MIAERFIADRISRAGQNKGNISGPIVKIGVAGISIGIAVMLLTVSIVLGFKGEITSRITGLTTHIAIGSTSMNGSNEPDPISISADTIALIRGIERVKHVQATAFKNGILRTDSTNEGILFKGVGQDFDFSFLEKSLVSGKLPGLSDSAASRDLLISQSLANKLHLQPGDRIQVYFISQVEVVDSISGERITKSDPRSRRFTVCGIFNTGFADFDERLSIIDIRQIRQLNGWKPGVCGNYEVTVSDFDKVDEGLLAVQEILGYNYSVRSVKEIYANIFTWLEKLDINGVIIVVLMIIVATMNMVTALLILILERANMVGLVKAMGMSNISVRRVFMFISMRLIARGLLWGNIAGIALCFLQLYLQPVKLDAATYYVDHVAIQVNWLYFLYLNIGTLVTCALMLILPTLILTRMTPVKTLKWD